MIKILEGTKETVCFEERSPFMLFDNDEYELYPKHWHTPLEIIMPTEGSYDVEISEVLFHLKQEDILIIAPCALHECKACKGKRIIFQADTQIALMFQELESIFSFINPAIVITKEDYPSCHETLVGLLCHIRDEYINNHPLKDAAICSDLLNFLVTFGRAYTSPPNRFKDIKPNKKQEYQDKFLSVCNYINEHCTEDLSLEQMADMVGFSKYHFSRLFKEFTNTSFYKYLNVRRIILAERLLMDPQINVTEAAVRSGFNSISAFMRMFKIVKGCTPTEFRKMYSN